MYTTPTSNKVTVPASRAVRVTLLPACRLASNRWPRPFAPKTLSIAVTDCSCRADYGNTLRLCPSSFVLREVRFIQLSLSANLSVRWQFGAQPADNHSNPPAPPPRTRRLRDARLALIVINVTEALLLERLTTLSTFRPSKALSASPTRISSSANGAVDSPTSRATVGGRKHF